MGVLASKHEDPVEDWLIDIEESDHFFEKEVLSLLFYKVHITLDQIPFADPVWYTAVPTVISRIRRNADTKDARKYLELLYAIAMHPGPPRLGPPDASLTTLAPSSLPSKPSSLPATLSIDGLVIRNTTPVCPYHWRRSGTRTRTRERGAHGRYQQHERHDSIHHSTIDMNQEHSVDHDFNNSNNNSNNNNSNNNNNHTEHPLPSLAPLFHPDTILHPPSQWKHVRATVSFTRGQYYWECVLPRPHRDIPAGAVRIGWASIPALESLDDHGEVLLGDLPESGGFDPGRREVRRDGMDVVEVEGLMDEGDDAGDYIYMEDVDARNHNINHNIDNDNENEKNSVQNHQVNNNNNINNNNNNNNNNNSNNNNNIDNNYNNNNNNNNEREIEYHTHHHHHHHHHPNSDIQDRRRYHSFHRETIIGIGVDMVHNQATFLINSVPVASVPLRHPRTVDAHGFFPVVSMAACPAIDVVRLRFSDLLTMPPGHGSLVEHGGQPIVIAQHPSPRQTFGIVDLPEELAQEPVLRDALMAMQEAALATGTYPRRDEDEDEDEERMRSPGGYRAEVLTTDIGVMFPLWRRDALDVMVTLAVQYQMDPDGAYWGLKILSCAARIIDNCFTLHRMGFFDTVVDCLTHTTASAFLQQAVEFVKHVLLHIRDRRRVFASQFLPHLSHILTVYQNTSSRRRRHALALLVRLLVPVLPRDPPLSLSQLRLLMSQLRRLHSDHRFVSHVLDALITIPLLPSSSYPSPRSSSSSMEGSNDPVEQEGTGDNEERGDDSNLFDRIIAADMPRELLRLITHRMLSHSNTSRAFHLLSKCLVNTAVVEHVVKNVFGTKQSTTEKEERERISSTPEEFHSHNIASEVPSNNNGDGSNSNLQHEENRFIEQKLWSTPPSSFQKTHISEILDLTHLLCLSAHQTVSPPSKAVLFLLTTLNHPHYSSAVHRQAFHTLRSLFATPQGGQALLRTPEAMRGLVSMAGVVPPVPEAYELFSILMFDVKLGEYCMEHVIRIFKNAFNHVLLNRCHPLLPFYLLAHVNQICHVRNILDSPFQESVYPIQAPENEKPESRMSAFVRSVSLRNVRRSAKRWRSNPTDDKEPLSPPSYSSKISSAPSMGSPPPPLSTSSSSPLPSPSTASFLSFSHVSNSSSFNQHSSGSDYFPRNVRTRQQIKSWNKSHADNLFQDTSSRQIRRRHDSHQIHLPETIGDYVRELLSASVEQRRRISNSHDKNEDRISFSAVDTQCVCLALSLMSKEPLNKNDIPRKDDLDFFSVDPAFLHVFIHALSVTPWHRHRVMEISGILDHSELLQRSIPIQTEYLSFLSRVADRWFYLNAGLSADDMKHYLQHHLNENCDYNRDEETDFDEDDGTREGDGGEEEEDYYYYLHSRNAVQHPTRISLQSKKQIRNDYLNITQRLLDNGVAAWIAERVHDYVPVMLVTEEGWHIFRDHHDTCDNAINNSDDNNNNNNNNNSININNESNHYSDFNYQLEFDELSNDLTSQLSYPYSPLPDLVRIPTTKSADKESDAAEIRRSTEESVMETESQNHRMMMSCAAFLYAFLALEHDEDDADNCLDNAPENNSDQREQIRRWLDLLNRFKVKDLMWQVFCRRKTASTKLRLSALLVWVNAVRARFLLGSDDIDNSDCSSCSRITKDCIRDALDFLKSDHLRVKAFPSISQEKYIEMAVDLLTQL